ncbi:MAG: sigma-70 family RNA polymerase sigma factor [Gammaproteobacteria bacterium]|nr:sigma-70 family RNA polymerase sigma factor [Gammaproteobacteria bacterium]
MPETALTAVADPDEALMRRFAAGDAAAFETLYRRHERGVWRFIRRSVASQAVADELMQEVWFAVARTAARYRPQARFPTWLYTLARHRVIDVWRRARPLASLDAPDPDGTPLLERLASGGEDEPLQHCAREEQSAALLDALAALPREQREAFLLQAECGLAVEEIAAATGVGFETAKSRLRYARARLQQALREHA